MKLKEEFWNRLVWVFFWVPVLVWVGSALYLLSFVFR